VSHEPGETTIGPPFRRPCADLHTYQRQSRNTARYPGADSNPTYPTLGLCGEAGEVADKVKKVIRDRGGAFTPEVIRSLELELGDVLWYVAQLATELGLDLDQVAQANLDKLASRAARNVISGDGDLR
jgi:NTP pyrophosphatase (non-canonical NTP hydrolase)